ncbi:MAG: hypothetical protein H5T64_11490 [Chloroflexi bacterium]|nr:hypothetical protein [Chloroflexota bacterium]
MTLQKALLRCLADIRPFSRYVVGRELRPYQLEPARAILDSVLHCRGLTFAIVMARQAGKNELSAQVEAYLLVLYHRVAGATIVKAAPTFRPQAAISLRRLRDCLSAFPQSLQSIEDGHIVCFGRAQVHFLSAHPQAHVVGQTASLLLECDEAQDVDPSKWDKEFAPMAASTNATTVFYGTAWTSNTLLSHQVRALHRLEAADGIRRVFVADAEAVATQVPAYRDYVNAEIARLGRQHPMIRTQYFLEEIDQEAQMFPPARQETMRGTHPRQTRPIAPGQMVAFLLDVAGGDETILQRPTQLGLPDLGPVRRDSTALTIVAVEPPTGITALPTYRVLDRRRWTGVGQPTLYAALTDLAETWHPRWIVVDATGIGAGLSGFLTARYPRQVIPYAFNLATKSDLGWGFLAVVDSGRYKEYADDGAPDTAQFWREVQAAQAEVLPGPARRMRWGVADPAVHDDLLVSAALCARLDEVDWRPRVAVGE